MRKAKTNRTLSMLRQAQNEIRHSVNNYRLLLSSKVALEKTVELQSARLAWLEQQAKYDRLLIEHLVETAKWSAKKGVQAGLGRN